MVVYRISFVIWFSTFDIRFLGVNFPIFHI